MYKYSRNNQLYSSYNKYIYITYILKIISLIQKIKAKNKQTQNGDYQGLLRETSAELLLNTKNTKKKLEAYNIKDHNSKTKDQIVIIKPKQILPIDPEHYSN